MHLEEWMVDDHRWIVPQDVCPLPEVVQQEARENHAEPSDDDGLSPEMAEIDVEALDACYGKKDRAEDDRRDSPVRDQEGDAVGRVEGQQDFGIADDPVETGESEGEKPDCRDRPENPGHPRCAETLHEEHAKDDDDGRRHHPGRKLWRNDRHPLHRRQH
jgi:hypothetical protein